MRKSRMKSRAFVAVFLLLTFGGIYWFKRREVDRFFDTKGLDSGKFPRQMEDDTIASPKIVVLSKRPGGANKSSAGSELFKQAKCRIPQLKLDDPQLKDFYKHVDPLKCSPEENWVFIKNQTFQISPKAEKKHGKISCNYQPFFRRSDHNTFSENIANMASGSPLKTDFFQTKCKAADGETFRNIYSTAVPDKERLKQLGAAEKPTDWSGLNFYLLGFDSISRMTFMRKMPKSYKFLTEELETVVLEGYNIVGDGTPQAFIPILTGKTEEELPLTRKRFKEAKYVNVYPFVWDEFSSIGYSTMYGEDSARVGTFTYRLKGFDKQPVDHYYRTFYQVAENDEYRHHATNCFGSEPQHVTFFRYAEDMFNNYPSDIGKFIILHHSALSHDDINTVELADIDLVDHLTRLKQKGHLDNTVVIVMSDHGHRFAKLRQTHQGQLEERLPFFSIAPPKKFAKGIGKKGVENLRANAKRLTTPFDIHPTLQALIHWTEPKRGDANKRSISLWDQVPMERTCSQAGIEPHWCTCLNFEDRPVDDPTALSLARALVQVINDQTKSERKLCAKLGLSKIESVKRLVPHKDLLKYKNVKDVDGFVPDLSGDTKIAFALYQIKFRTVPGDAFYEATVSYDLRSNELTVDLGAISHINAFGDKPHCIIDKDYFLAKWCICYDKITKSD